jgi:hypothetical protein
MSTEQQQHSNLKRKLTTTEYCRRWKAKHLAEVKMYQRSYQRENRWKYKQMNNEASKKYHALQRELKRIRLIGLN